MIKAIIKSFSYPTGNVVLRDMDIHIPAGEFVVITGTSGSGKSTLVQCLTGVIPHFIRGDLDGKVEIKGRDLSSLSLPAISRFMAYAGQEPQNQLFNLTVYEDMAFGPGNLCLSRDEIHTRVEWALNFVGGRHLAGRQPDTLSGGETQRCALASYIVMGQEVLVLDQPCRELDPAGRKMVYDNIYRLHREQGLTVVVVEDRPAELAGLAGRFLVLDDGKIVIDEEAGAFMSHYNLAELGLSPLYKSCPEHFSPSAPPKGQQKKCGADHGEPLVQVEELWFGYKGDSFLFRGLNLQVFSGEVVSLLGPNGAGKTTLAKLIGGILKPVKGVVKVNGTTGYLFQNPDQQLFGSSIWDEVAFSLKRKRISPDEIEKKVNRVLEIVRLDDLAGAHPYTLSRGQRKLLALATALVMEPAILIVDEPTGGLDCRQADLVAEIFTQFSHRGGSILLISHDPDLVKALSRKAFLLHGGSLREVKPDGTFPAVS